jgi:hypothetical protein
MDSAAPDHRPNVGWPARAGRAARAAALAVGLSLIAAACTGPLTSSETAPGASPSATNEARSAVPSPSTGPRATPAPSPIPSWTTIAWTEADRGPFSGRGNQYVFGGVVWSGGFVLVGEEAPLPTGTVDGVVWTSPDGRHWQRISNADRTFGGAEIRSVAARGSTLVAVGVSRVNDQAQTLTPPIGLAWTSPDGTHWQRVPDGAQVLGRLVLAGIASGPGGFVAYGHDLTGAQVVLYSKDGVTWERDSASDQAFSGSSIAAITGTGEGFAAVGSRNTPGFSNGTVNRTPGPAAAWWSTDGRTWHASDVGSGGYALGGVQPWVGSLRAVGSSGCGGCVGPPLEWRSTDGGQTWRQLPQPSTPSAMATTSVLVDGRVVTMQFQPRVTEWTDDDRTWHPLQMVGASGLERLQLMLVGGEAIIGVAPFSAPPPGNDPNDQIDMRVFLGVLQ